MSNRQLCGTLMAFQGKGDAEAAALAIQPRADIRLYIKEKESKGNKEPSAPTLSTYNAKQHYNTNTYLEPQFK